MELMCHHRHIEAVSPWKSHSLAVVSGTLPRVEQVEDSHPRRSLFPCTGRDGSNGYEASNLSPSNVPVVSLTAQVQVLHVQICIFP